MPKHGQFDKKFFRILTTVRKLAEGEKVSSRDLADEFNVSIRTVQRDIELLNMAGFLVVSQEKGYHTFEEGYSLRKMQLSVEEASLLSFFYEIARSLGENFEKSFRKMIAKISQEEHESPFYAKVPDGLKIKADYPFVKELERAIREERKVLLRYQTPERQKTYKVCPLKIVFFDGFWYLLAHVPDRDSKLKFRLEKILELETLDEYFERPKDLKTLLDESVNIWFSDRRDKKVALRIDKEAAHFFKERKYFPLQKITKENKDGSLMLETKVAHYMEVVPTITHWIPWITVLSPAEFKKGIEDTVEGYLEKIRGSKSK